MTFDPLSPANPVTLESVKANLAQWRQTRTKGKRIPKHLWDDLATLAKQLDCRHIAAELRINPNRLQEVVEKQSRKAAPLPTHDFVEFPLASFPILPPSHQTNTQGTLEFTRADGTILKASGLAHGHLRSLVKDFLGQ